MSKKKEKWDCIAVDRVDRTGRIYLTNPQQYGIMYVSCTDNIEGRKVRNSIPTECGPVKGSSNEDKFVVAIAIATALNNQLLKASGGLVLRGFVGGTPFATPDTWIVNSPGIGLHVKGTTGWIAYISPAGGFYAILNDRYKGNELPPEQSDRIRGCIEHISRNWGLISHTSP